MRKTFSLPVAATAAGGGVTPPPADTVDNIEHSVRFNSADSARLNRTPSSAGNRRTWTWSGWAKRSKLGSTFLEGLFAAGTSIANVNSIWLGYFYADTIAVLYYANGMQYHVETSTKFRDPSAWYHVLVAFDSTQATASDRIKIYVNGTEQTSFSVSSYPALNFEGWINNTDQHGIGTAYAHSGSYNGYLANVHFVDGQALTPSSFGFTDSNGVWQPKAYTGSYGTNGFHLDFADTSSATALGNDVSGNNNDWTPSGLVAGPAYTANSFSTEFDGTGDYLTTPSDTNVGFGTGDFTVEAWFYSNGTQGSAATIICLNDGSGGNDWQFQAAGSDIKLRELSTLTATYTHNEWHHAAWTRQGSSNYLFLDGVQVGTVSDSTDYDYGSFKVGSNRTSSAFFNGKISNVRVIKGQALYTSNFTPPTVALTTTSQGATASNVKLLTCQDSTFIDNSPSAHTITANGNAATTTVSPFEPVDGSDAMLDSPTNYGSGDTVRGNYCTLNPLTTSNATQNPSDGNLVMAFGGTYPTNVLGTFGVSSGKWYWEVGFAGGSSGSGHACGVANGAWANKNVDPDNQSTPNHYIDSRGYFYNSGTGTTNSTNFGPGDIIGIALDVDNDEVSFYLNGTIVGSAQTLETGQTWFPFHKNSSFTALTQTVNFGQQPFKYPLAGYKSLCSTNLPTPAIADGSTAMDVALYTGTSSGAVVSTPNMSPDLVWIKDRGNTFNHQLFDTIRGANSALLPNLTSAENNYNSFTSFDSTGFTVPNVNGTGANGNNHVAWTWDAGSSTVTNEDGTITSQVRANPTAGISIISWTGTGVGASVGHDLNKVPGMVIIKDRDNTGNPNPTWLVWHTGLGTKYTYWNNSSSLLTASSTTRGGLGVPTSTTVTLTSGSTDAYTPNMIGNDYIGYVFAPVEGFSSFGSYTGSTSGAFVYTGMRPRWLMIKRTDTTSDWQILDTEREGYNVDNDPLWANLNTQEGTTDIADILSNGFKMRDGATGDYIYAAFAEHPFKTSRAR